MKNSKEAWKTLWAKACKWEKIPESSKFIIFSDSNPYLTKLNKAASDCQRELAQQEKLSLAL
jgi:hypothetical protein